MKTHLIAQVAVTAVVVAVCLGLLAPKSGHATGTTFQVDLFPPYTALTCGWHAGACWNYPTPVASGWALDWSNGTNMVAMNLKSYYSGGSYSYAGSANFSYSNTGSCDHVTTIEILDMNNGWRSDTKHLHTATTGASYYWVNTGTSQTSTSFYVGTPVDETGCAWYGYHVHQESGGGGYNPGNYPDEDSCNRPNNASGCNSIPDTSLYSSMGSSWTLP